MFARRLTLFAFLLKNFQAKEKLELRWPKGPNLSWPLRCTTRWYHALNRNPDYWLAPNDRSWGPHVPFLKVYLVKHLTWNVQTYIIILILEELSLDNFGKTSVLKKIHLFFILFIVPHRPDVLEENWNELLLFW